MGMKYKLAITEDRTIKESYADLAGAIIAQAIKDYRSALKSVMDGRTQRQGEVESLEKFFRSEWFIWLINGQITGEYCIAEVQKQCKKTLKRF